MLFFRRIFNSYSLNHVVNELIVTENAFQTKMRFSKLTIFRHKAQFRTQYSTANKPLVRVILC